MRRFILMLIVFAVATGSFAIIQMKASTNVTVEEEIEQVLNTQRNLALKKDVATMKEILADEYLSTNAYGDVRNKVETVRNYERDKLTYQALELSEVRILVLNPTAAVANFLVTTREFNAEKNRDDSGYFRVTRVLTKRNGRWQVVVNHSTSTMP